MQTVASFERQASWFNPLRGYSTNDKAYELKNIKFHDGKEVYFSVGRGWLEFSGIDKTKAISLEQLRNATKVNLSKQDNFLIKEIDRYDYSKNDLPYRTLYIYAPEYEIIKDMQGHEGYEDLTTVYEDSIKIKIPESVEILREAWELSDEMEFSFGKERNKLVEGVPIIVRTLEQRLNYRTVATPLGSNVSTLQAQLEAQDIKLDTYAVLRLIEHFTVEPII
jgi:hypothetical protein